MAEQRSGTAAADPRRCIALTDRHTQCKGKAQPGREFCKRHAPRPALGVTTPTQDGTS